MGTKDNCRNELRTAIRQLSDRCLYSASRWYIIPFPPPLNPSPHFPHSSAFQNFKLFFFQKHYLTPWWFAIDRAAEQLVGIEQDPAKYTPSHTRFQRGSSSIRRRFRTNEAASTPIAGVSYVSTPVPEDDSEAVDSDFYLLAKSYFDCREYRRAAHVLRDQCCKKALFLRCYSLYLVRFSSIFPFVNLIYPLFLLHKILFV